MIYIKIFDRLDGPATVVALMLCLVCVVMLVLLCMVIAALQIGCRSAIKFLAKANLQREFTSCEIK